MAGLHAGVTGLIARDYEGIIIIGANGADILGGVR